MSAQGGLHMRWSQGNDGDTSSRGRKHDSYRASNGCVRDTSFTLCCQQTPFRQGQKFLTGTACIGMARDSRCLVPSRHIHQTRSQAFEQTGEFSLALAWAFGGQNTRGATSSPAQFL